MNFNFEQNKTINRLLSHESFETPSGVTITGNADTGTMHVGINNAFISDYSITVNNEGISIKHKGNEQIYYKNEIVRLFVDSYTVGVEPEYDGFLNIGRSSSIKGYTAKKKSPNAFFITGKKEKIFRLAMVLKRGGYGKEETAVIFDYFNVDAQSKQKFFFDNTFPPMYLFRYIKQEADKLLGTDDAMAQSEAPYELADNMDSKRLSYIKFINNGNSKEIVTDLPNVFVYQLLGSVIFFLASVYCIFTVYSEGLCQLAVMTAGMSALIFYMNAVSKCRYLIRFSDFKIFISKKNLFGKQDVVLKGEMDDFINIIPCEFQSKRDKVHQSFFYIKIIMKKNKEDIPQAVNLSEQSEASLLFSVLFNANNLSRLFPKNIDSPYDVINLFEENRFNSEQAEFLVRKMKEFFGVKS